MEECMICFEETNNFIIFTCSHKMCYNCLKTFLKQSTTCPVCDHLIISPLVSSSNVSTSHSLTSQHATPEQMLQHHVIIPRNQNLRNIIINQELESIKVCLFICFFFGLITYIINFVL